MHPKSSWTLNQATALPGSKFNLTLDAFTQFPQTIILFAPMPLPRGDISLIAQNFHSKFPFFTCTIVSTLLQIWHHNSHSHSSAFCEPASEKVRRWREFSSPWLTPSVLAGWCKICFSDILRRIIASWKGSSVLSAADQHSPSHSG